MFRQILAVCVISTASLSAQDFGLAIGDGKKESIAVSIVSEFKTVTPSSPFRVAVKMVHAPHFHTYGKVIAKGATGKPTKLTWTLPEGWSAEELPWPATTSFESFGVKADGYEGTVFLPVTITPRSESASGTAVKLQVNGLP